MKKTAAGVYGLVAYLLFLFVFAYSIAFIANIVVPKSIDSGELSPVWLSAIIDTGLLALFALQHSGMARRIYKKWENRFISSALQRSTYVLMASLTLLLLYWQWRPIPVVLWNITLPWIRWLLWVGYAFGWAIVFVSTFMISHAQLFGLHQVLLYLRSRGMPAPRFQMTGFYRYVRHPLLLGFLIAFWSAPQMTTGRLLFSLASTGYILIGSLFEERDLLDEFGDIYREYRHRVPRLIPYPKMGITMLKTRNLQARLDETKLE